MSALSTRRVAAVTMAGLVTGAATLAAAPAALAAPARLPTPVLSDTTVVAGQSFTLSFAKCLPDVEGGRTLVWYEVYAGEDLIFVHDAYALPDGSAVIEESFVPGTPSGEYTIAGVCDRFSSVQFYPPVTVTVAETAPTTPGPGEGTGKKDKDKKDKKDKGEKKGKDEKGKGEKKDRAKGKG